MNWDGITHIFQIPLEWFREITRRTNIIGDGRFIEVERNNPDGTVLRINADELAGAVGGDEYVTIGTAQSITGAKSFTNTIYVNTATGTADYAGGAINLRRNDGVPFISFFESSSATSSKGYLQLTAAGTMVVGSRNGGIGVQLAADANTARLSNAPTIGQADKTSKAIATCGWCNSQLAQVDHTHDDAYAAKTHTHGNITSTGTLGTTTDSIACMNGSTAVSSSGNDVRYSRLKALIDCSGFVTDASGTGYAPKNLYLCQNVGSKTSNGIFLRGGNDASIEFYPTGAAHGGYIDFHLQGATTADYSSRIYEGTRDQIVALHLISTYGVRVDAPANKAELKNTPTLTGDDATDSKAIATLGWVKSNFVESSDDAVTEEKKVVTGVTWNGTQIVIASETWSFENGLLVGTAENAAETIDTVTYNQ